MTLSKTVAKLIDQAILPAVLIVAAKILSTFFINWFLAKEFKIETNGFFHFLPIIKYSSYQDYFSVNSISNLIMFVVVAAGCIFILVKAHFLHQSHISPILHAKLARSKLSKMITSNFQLYHQAAVWLAFLWLVTLLLVFEAIFKISSQPLAIFAIIFAINSTWFLIVDIEHEVEIARKTNF